MLIKAFFIAFLFSFFIYSEVFGKSFIYLNSIFALTALFFILKADKKELFWIGFFIGVLWFYWIGLSFRYYNLSWMIPIVIIFVGLVYGTIFFIIEKIGHWTLDIGHWIIKKLLPFTPSPLPHFTPYHLTTLPPYHLIIKSLLLLTLSYIHPFGFNWFIPELTLVNTIFSFDKLSFFFILISLYLIGHRTLDIRHLRIWNWEFGIGNLGRFFIIFVLFFLAVDFKDDKPKMPNLKIYLSETKIPQDKKWDPRYLQKIVKINFEIIDNAIKNRYDLVVLPESAFPMYLNIEDDILTILKQKSKKITIVTGALHLKENLSYNSTYIFNDGNYIIADKVVLVPFGEKTPLPKPIARYINRIFFNGAQDYEKAKNPTDYQIKDIKFRNAICYEATHPLLYKNAPKYMIALSNNAWFTPSIEPILQNLIIKYYAKLYKMVVYHSCNIAKSDVIW